MKGFTHLHVHSMYSLLDGAAKLDEMVSTVAADGQVALGLTDHGSMSGVVDFYSRCKAGGVKPIVGCELYQAESSVADRPKRRSKGDDDGGGDTDSGKLYYHLTALAESNVGYKNLIQLSSQAYLRGYYYKPRVDWDMLSQFSEDVIVTSGCLGGLVLQHLSHGRYDQAVATAGRLQDIFGRDNFFVELQDHGLNQQKATLLDLLRVAREIDAPLLAVNDSHYCKREDHLPHSALLCVQTGSRLDDPNRFKFEGSEHYLKSEAEMRRLFAELPSACDNTMLVAERCNVEIVFGENHLPKFVPPPQFVSDDQYLTHLVVEGMDWRWPNASDEVVARIVYELKTIIQMGFSSYFLILHDLVQYANRNNIPCGKGRGSSAASAVLFALGVTGVDPLKFDLPFERFLNPSRVSLPDVDWDVSPLRRDELIRYAQSKYGDDRVAQIVTFGYIKARSAVKDSARILGLPYEVGDRVSKMLPPLVMGKSAPLKACLELDPEFEDAFAKSSDLRDLVAADGDVGELVDLALGIEGLIRSDGIHAAGVVISDVPLTDFVPVQQRGDGKPVVTQYDMQCVEDLGLLKMDFLGLRNLDVIADCVAMLAADGVVVDLDAVGLDDAATFDLLRAGETVGTFQLEGAAMRQLLVRLAPKDFNDIVACVALYRPGPMAANMHNDYADRRNGRQPVVFFHPDAEPILKDSQGLMFMQEDVMNISRRFAGFSLAEADLLRKAMGKKKAKLMAEQRDLFVAGCDVEGYGVEFGEKLFDVIEKFSDYSFSKCHAVPYGLLAYQTAFLKARFPSYYMASVCSSVSDDAERVGFYLAECRRLGLKILGPDVQSSSGSFSAGPGWVQVGLACLKGMGAGLADAIAAERASEPFVSVSDFVCRVRPLGLNKRQLMVMADAGCFDSLGVSRQGVKTVVDELLKTAKKYNDTKDSGQGSLFDTRGLELVSVPDAEYSKSVLLGLEKQAVGVYVSGHPLEQFEELINKSSGCGLVELPELESGSKVSVCCVIDSVTPKRTKAGKQMANIEIEDLTGKQSAVVFPRQYESFGSQLKPGHLAVLGIDVKWSDWSSKNDLIVESVDLVGGGEQIGGVEAVFKFRIPDRLRDDSQAIANIKGCLLQFPGDHSTHMFVSQNTFVDLDIKTDGSDGLVSALKELIAQSM